MKRLLITLSILAFAGLVVAIGVSGAPSADVAATVTVKNISVTVSPSSFAYGVLNAGQESSASAVITATNNGNVTENLTIRGAVTAAWVLGAAAGAETYVHKFSTDADYTTWTALTLDYQNLAAGVASTGTDEFKLKITVPTSTGTYNQQSAAVTVLAQE